MTEKELLERARSLAEERGLAYVVLPAEDDLPRLQVVSLRRTTTRVSHDGVGRNLPRHRLTAEE